MTRLLAYVLTTLLLFQTLGQELLVLNFALNRQQIAAQYCVNKARPTLHCDGQCYLARQLRRRQQQESKAPGISLLKLKVEAVMPPLLQLPALPCTYPVARRYARLRPVPGIAAFLGEVFHPPVV